MVHTTENPAMMKRPCKLINVMIQCKRMGVPRPERQLLVARG